MEHNRFPVGAAVMVAVLGAVFSWPYLEPIFERAVPGTLLQSANVLDPIVSQEEQFDVPVPANWRGAVVGVLESGRAYAIERPDGELFYAFFEEGVQVPFEGDVHIRGLWLGMTCAYRNTVFSGDCVPEVKIREIIDISEF